MGIYLAIYAVSDATIERLHADPPLACRVMDSGSPEWEAKARAERQPRPGFLSRLMGAKAEPPPPPPPLELAPGEGGLGPDGDYEKSWHGLHYLLTGTDSGGEPPLNFLMGGGRELELDDGDTPLLTHSSAETRRIADALLQLSDEEARRRADPEEIRRLDLYPGVWHQAEDLKILLEDLRRLRTTVSDVAARGLGLLVSIS
ncbi:MAG TPA: YfbM family protein [Gemmatimonadales bacterium]|nr:YfbM family protein [Gemmatimonadales bacterium]